jgi:hypothetical protein
MSAVDIPASPACAEHRPPSPMRRARNDHRPPPDELAELVRTLQSSLYLRVEVQDGWVALRSGIREGAIGAVNLETGALTARVPRDMVGPLLREHRRLRRTSDGVGVRVTDRATCRAAEVLIRWRMEVERYAPQMRNASP